MAQDFTQNSQSVQDPALPVTRQAARTTTQTILSNFDIALDQPLRMYASNPADALLNFSADAINFPDGTQKRSPIITDITDTPAATVNFQTGATTGATFDLTFPGSSVGYYRRCSFTRLPGGTIKGVFSPEVGSLGSLAAPTFVAGGTQIGHLDLVATASTAFKTAGSSTDIIENAKIVNAPKSVTDRATQFSLDRGGNWGWVLATNTLSISEDAYVQVLGLADARNRIAAGSFTLSSDGDVLVVNLNLSPGGSAALTTSVVSVSSVVPKDTTYVVARRVGNEIIIGGFMNLKDGESKTLGVGGGGGGDIAEIRTRLLDALSDGTNSFVTPVAFSEVAEDLTDSSTATYDSANKSYKFDAASENWASKNLLDSEFLGLGEDLSDVELRAFWDLDKTINTAKTYEVSRDGGNEWQTVSDMERNGTTDEFVGTHAFATEASNNDLESYTTTADTYTELNATTAPKLGQHVLASSSEVVRSITINIAKSSNWSLGEGSIKVSLYKADADFVYHPGLQNTDKLIESAWVDLSTVSDGNNTIPVTNTILIDGSNYSIQIETDSAYKTNYSAGTKYVRINGVAAGTAKAAVYNSPSDNPFFYANFGGANNTVRSTPRIGDAVFVAGAFTSVNGSTRNRLIKISDGGVEDASFYTNLGSGGVSNSINSADTDGTSLFVGGLFTSIGATSCARVAKISVDGVVNSSFATNMGTGFDSTVNVVRCQPDGKILVGGNFSSFNGNSRNCLVRLNADGTEDTAFYTALGSAFSGGGVIALALLSDGSIIVGGAFSSFNSNTRNRLIKLSSAGVEDSSFYTNLGSGGVNSSVYALKTLQDGTVLVGGDFTTVGGVSKIRLIKVDSSGNQDAAFYTNLSTSFNDSIRSLGQHSSTQILVGGSFVLFKGNTRNRLVRLNLDGTEDTAFYTRFGGTDNGVYSIVESASGDLLIGGAFTAINSVTRNNLTQVYSGDGWGQASHKANYALSGRALDLRVRVTSTDANEAHLMGVGALYRQEGTPALSELEQQTFSFTGDTYTFQVTNFLPNPNTLKVYWKNTGKVFVHPDFTINGYNVTFEAGTFNTGSEETLLFDQTHGSAIDTSDANAANIATLESTVTQNTSRITTLENSTPTLQKFTSGSGTYTTPTGVKWIRVRMVGGGGGGGGGASTGNTGGAGGAGNNTTFGTTLLAANGGSGGAGGNSGAGEPSGGNGGTASLGTGPVGLAMSGGKGGYGWNMIVAQYAPGGAGAASVFGGAGNGTFASAGGSPATNSGSGGQGGGVPTQGLSGAGGGAGGFVDAIIVTPSASYSYAVGSGGTAGTAGTGGYAGAVGAAGIILVEEYYK